MITEVSAVVIPCVFLFLWTNQEMLSNMCCDWKKLMERENCKNTSFARTQQIILAASRWLSVFFNIQSTPQPFDDLKVFKNWYLKKKSNFIQTPISPELKWFRSWFWLLVREISCLRYTLILGVPMWHDTTAGCFAAYNPRLGQGYAVVVKGLKLYSKYGKDEFYEWH